MSNGVMTCLPPHHAHPGVEIIWAADCREAFNQGVKLAQTWLDNGRLVRLSARTVPSPHHHFLCWKPGVLERWECAAFAEWLKLILA